MRALAWSGLAIGLLWTSGAIAQPDEIPEAGTARLPILTPGERALLAPHLERGPIVFVEFMGDAELPAVIMATHVEAPAATVAEVLADPESYPGFMPALDSVEIVARDGPVTGYRWAWQMAMFTLTGQNVMTVYPAPSPRHAAQGHRVEVRSIGGDMGHGRMLWRVYPRGSGGSLLVFSSRIDMRNANYIAEQTARGGNSLNRTINISLGYVMMMGTRDEAHRRAGFRSPAPGPLPEIARPEIDHVALGPMLFRGDLMLLEMSGDRLDQAAFIGRMGLREDRVRPVIVNPAEFGQTLIDGSRATVVSRDDEGADFDWEIPLPLVGGGGRMRIEEHGDVVHVDGVRGNLSQGRWRFDTVEYPWGEVALVGWARFDPADSSWLVRRIVEGVPHFGEGLAAGGQLMILRSVRKQARR